MNRKIMRFTASLLLASISTGFAGCSGSTEADSEKLSVVTTIFPQYDFARQIGGDKIELKMLVTPGGESHSYEPTPQDIIAVSSCDIFICTGGESDVWTNSILSSINTDEITVIKLMDCVETVEEEIVEGMTAKTDDEEETEYDEHVWTSLKNAQAISNVIGEAMISLDSANAEFYRENLDSYIAELQQLDEQYQEAVDSAGNNVLIFGDRFPFRYLFNDYDLEYYAAFPGCSTETDVSASTMSFLIEKVNTLSIPVVYYIEFSAQKIADTIAAETGAETLLFHSCHTVSQEDMNNGVTYIDIMRQNLDSLKRGLGIEAD